MLEYISKLNEDDRVGITSSQAEFLKEPPDGKSRVSVIFFFCDVVQEGILEYEERSGKGGYHRIYYLKMNREQFAQHVIEMATKELVELFPLTQK